MVWESGIFGTLLLAKIAASVLRNHTSYPTSAQALTIDSSSKSLIASNNLFACSIAFLMLFS